MMMENAIDAHVHLWDPQRHDDILICDAHPELNDKATRDALRTHLTGSAFSRAIAVQSAPDDAHSDWLIKHSAQLASIAGVVAWIDPTATNGLDQAKRLIAQPRVCGVRLMLNRMAAPKQLLAAGPQAVLALLATHQVTIELLSPPDQLGFANDLASRIPGKIVVDHCGLPSKAAVTDPIWRNGLQDLARRPNVATKMSGLIEPFSEMPHDEVLFETMDFALELFGSDRLMAASNFPVAQLTAPERIWEARLVSWAKSRGLSRSQQAALWRDCAATWFPRINLESTEND